MGTAKKNRKSEKLILWQRRLAAADSAFSAEVEKMNRRERLYGGDSTLRPLVPGEDMKGCPKRTSHVRNIIFENIESQVSSGIPQPKVTPRWKEDEHLANVIEHFLRNELDRLPFETINDMAERTVPIQGGVGFLIEWDNDRRTSSTVGEVTVSSIHPKQFAPQPGVYTSIEDMDWFIVKIPTTKEAVLREFGVDVRDEGEAEPDVRAAEGADSAEDAVTRYVGFARNDGGGIDRYSWVNDVELEDLENYQARRQPVCTRCGRVRPLRGEMIGGQGGGLRGAFSEEADTGMVSADRPPEEPPIAGGGRSEVYDGEGPCPWCGNDTFTTKEQAFEEIPLDIVTGMGHVIPKGSRIPFYKPDLFPIILQRSVSVYGKLLGNSDVDVIADQQNTVNRMEQKIIDRLVKAGTRITLPDKANLRTDPEDGERWYIGNPADKAMIDVYDFKGDLQYELMYLANVYEEARQILGITDSFQGRADTTATSGKAKEFSAAQAAGRLESKRTMKNAAYAAIFEEMFKFALAYSDEPRPVSYQDFKGERRYEEFNRYDFLAQDRDGQWYWNDQFLFSCDTSAPLASNREAMWQETRQNLQSGAFGDPAQLETLVLFWAKMEELHYPGAGTTKAFLEEKLEREMQRAAQTEARRTVAPAPQPQAAQGGIPPEIASAVEQRARRDVLEAIRGTGM